MNPVALVTGASRGIGRGIALALARTGYDLVVGFVRRPDAAQESAEACRRVAAEAGLKIRALPCQADVASAPDRKALIEFARDQFGRLDLLVNNAGVAPESRADLLEVTEDSYDRLMGVNAKGPFFLTQLAARWMIEQVQAAAASSDCRKPKIVTISSVSAYAPSVNRGDYCMAKAALSMLTPLFAARLGEYGIRTYEIRPGIVETDMTAGVRLKYDELIRGGLTPIARWGSPDDVGKAVLAIAMDLLPFSTGEVINVDGGFHVRRL